MKKIIISILTFLIYTLTFSNNYEDYKIFIDGKNAYYSADYENAKKNFEVLLRTFSSSTVFNENYAYFFIGMTYYELKDYKKAALYLEKAVYTPKKSLFSNDSDLEKIIFFSERDFSLGQSLINIGDIEKGKIYLQRVDYNTFFPFAAHYEEKALEILGKYDPQFKNKEALKFHYDFSKINTMKIPELLRIGDYYASQKNYKIAKEFYEYILKNTPLDGYGETVNKRYLKVLIQLKDYKELIKFTRTPPKEYKDLYNFYRGLAFYQLKDFTRALFLFDGIKDKKYMSMARYYAAGIYFALGDYKSTIDNAKLVTDKNIISQSMLGFSYLYLGNEKAFDKVAKEVIQNYPSSYTATYFMLLLKHTKDIPTKISSIQDLGKLASTVIINSKPLPSDFIKKADLLEIDQLSQIAEFGDKDLLQIAFDKGNFLNKGNIAYGYSTTIILENGQFYHLALRNSNEYMGEFLQYKDLLRYNYPRYFKDEVNYCSKKYDVPQEMIYTILNNISGFNIYYVSEDSRFGLMGITPEGNQGYSLFQVFDPQVNIEIGTKLLRKYLDLYEGNKLKALIAYVHGQKYVSSLYFSDNNDLSFNSIIIPEERYYLENMFLTFVFYSKLYEY